MDMPAVAEPGPDLGEEGAVLILPGIVAYGLLDDRAHEDALYLIVACGEADELKLLPGEVGIDALPILRDHVKE